MWLSTCIHFVMATFGLWTDDRKLLRWMIGPHYWQIFFGELVVVSFHDDVIKWKHFPRYWPFVRGIHRSPVNSPHTGQWRGALMFSLICTRINGWVNNGEAGHLRRHRAHYDVTVMSYTLKWYDHCLYLPQVRCMVYWQITSVYLCYVCNNEIQQIVQIPPNTSINIWLLSDAIIIHRIACVHMAH